MGSKQGTCRHGHSGPSHHTHGDPVASWRRDGSRVHCRRHAVGLHHCGVVDDVRGCCIQVLCVECALLCIWALLGVGTSHRVYSSLVWVGGGGIWWHSPAGGGTGHFIRCARSVTCLEGRICSRVHVGGVGRSCCCIAHGETSWITNSFGICIGNPRRTRTINRIHDFENALWWRPGSGGPAWRRGSARGKHREACFFAWVEL